MDALILGGGPAGAAAAIDLARGGLRPLILERQRGESDALCGGFLSWTSLAALERLGVDRVSLGGHRVERMALFAGPARAQVPLPAMALGVSRQRLDACLLARAEQAGAAVERGVTVRGLKDDHLVTADGAMLRHDRMVLATGKHDLRGLSRPPATGARMVGLRWRLAVSPALVRMVEHTIELHCFDGGYAGLVMQEETVNLCLAVTQERLSAEGTPEALLQALSRECPALEQRLGAARDIGGRQAIANVPYGWMAQATAPGIYRIGDQAGVIASLAGEGMGIALTSGALAARAILQEQSAQRFQPDLARRLRRPVGVAGMLAGLVSRPLMARVAVGMVGLAPRLAHIAAQLARVGRG
jgi:flavin-dependent dehydrogenase